MFVYSFCISFYIIINIVYTSAYTSGFYIDNGYDQTIIDYSMTRQEKREVEHEILNVLGLPTRPKKNKLNSPMKKSAPKFLLNVYKSLLEDQNGRYKRSEDSELNLNSDEQYAIDESDIIMTFESQSMYPSLLFSSSTNSSIQFLNIIKENIKNVILYLVSLNYIIWY